MDLFHISRYGGEEKLEDEGDQDESLKKILRRAKRKRKQEEESKKPEKETKKKLKVSEEPSEEKESVPDEKSNDSEEIATDSKTSEEVTGTNNFQVIGDDNLQKKKTVLQRKLPKWLRDPENIEVNINQNTTSIDGLEFLSSDLITQLKENSITHLFPVQSKIIPMIMQSTSTVVPPRDICCAAPTGSGKTLSYVLPLVNNLKDRVVRKIRVLVVLPVRELAKQVFNVFQTYSKKYGLNTALLASYSSFQQEQKNLTRENLLGEFESLADIVVATPGRLVDHVYGTKGFDLRHLRYIVLDEADRIMEEEKHDWINVVEKSIYSTNRKRLVNLNVAKYLDSPEPLQKLLFSATLSTNPEKLEYLKLYNPILVSASTTCEIPPALNESYVLCSIEQKPLVILSLILHYKYKRVLCFTNTIDGANRLYWLLKLIGDIKVHLVSSSLTTSKRQRLLNSFSKGKVDILICSNALARGIDVENVNCVISYDCPTYLETYVHRVGRTARAGKAGTAITIVDEEEHRSFKKIIKSVSRQSDNLNRINIDEDKLTDLLPKLTKALQSLPAVLKIEKPIEALYISQEHV
ncbi:DgyrCDS5555 [Dimorphilus gyrociliatus]|uniref:ATP-dependent RNA helicase n=1 Tax=Dimorphilus gyrociliatus TaxID=2664684 RepID=A0A7I8VLW2_9ANNE|nr:DgyrCDS5555 [Dimorphilus gyrociliatus]